MDASTRWKSVAPLVGVLALVAVVWIVGRSVPVPDLVEWLRGRVDALGPILGPCLFIVVYVIATFVAVPGTPLTLLAGAAFGAWRGLLVMTIASTASAALTFLLTRHTFRGLIARRFGRTAMFQQVERLLERKGPMVVAASRLVPVFPFLGLNYAWGLTGIPARTYVLWSAVGMIPMNLVYLALGQSAIEALTGDLPPETLVVVGAALVVAAAGIALSYRFLRSG